MEPGALRVSTEELPPPCQCQAGRGRWALMVSHKGSIGRDLHSHKGWLCLDSRYGMDYHAPHPHTRYNLTMARWRQLDTSPSAFQELARNEKFRDCQEAVATSGWWTRGLTKSWPKLLNSFDRPRCQSMKCDTACREPELACSMSLFGSSWYKV